MKNIWVIALFSTLLLVGCHTPGERFDPYTKELPNIPTMQSARDTNRLSPDLLKPSSRYFTLGPGDLVEIELLDDLGSRATTTVGPDGKLYFNLLPGVDVWGLTLTEAKEALEKEFSRFVKEKPQISITLREVVSRRIWLLGRFQAPGVYSMTNSTTLLDAILQAGGPANFAGDKDLSVANNTDDLADLRRSFILRQGQFLPVDFQRLLKQGDLTQNVYLEPDDFIYMPASTSRDVYVLGAVLAPRSIAYSEELTLAGAIANAAGPARYAYQSHVAIVRGSLSDPQIALVDYKDIITGRIKDIALEPRDIVYVPYKPYQKISKYWDLIMNTFVSTVAINEGARAAVKNAPPTSGILIPFGSTITVNPSATPAR